MLKNLQDNFRGFSVITEDFQVQSVDNISKENYNGRLANQLVKSDLFDLISLLHSALTGTIAAISEISDKNEGIILFFMLFS